MALFFGSAIAFAAVRRLTEDEGTAVTLVAQVAVLGLIVGAIVLVVRRLDDGDGSHDDGSDGSED
jgi:Co/Zn/Cd efflux system component